MTNNSKGSKFLSFLNSSNYLKNFLEILLIFICIISIFIGIFIGISKGIFSPEILPEICVLIIIIINYYIGLKILLSIKKQGNNKCDSGCNDSTRAKCNMEIMKLDKSIVLILFFIITILELELSAKLLIK